MFYLIKVSNDFIEEPEALQSFFVDVRFGVELFKIWNGCKHDAHQVVGLVVQILQDTKRRGIIQIINAGFPRTGSASVKHHPQESSCLCCNVEIASSYLVLPVACQEMLRHMCRQDVLQQNPVEVLHRFDLLALLLKLVLPQKV